VKIDFFTSEYDNCVYMLKIDGKVILYLLIYMNDILITSSTKKEIGMFKEKLNGEFEMKDLGFAKRIMVIMRN